MSALGVDSPKTTPIVTTTWRRPTVAVVTLEGEHDMASVPQLEQALGNALLTCSQLVVRHFFRPVHRLQHHPPLIKMKREADDKRCDFRLVLNGDAPNIETPSRSAASLECSSGRDRRCRSSSTAAPRGAGYGASRTGCLDWCRARGATPGLRFRASAPASEGWFVVNERDAEWWFADSRGARCAFDTSTATAGRVRPARDQRHRPGGRRDQPLPAESNQEAFLALAGECRLVVEGEERLLRPWDFFNRPPGPSTHSWVRGTAVRDPDGGGAVGPRRCGTPCPRSRRGTAHVWPRRRPIQNRRMRTPSGSGGSGRCTGIASPGHSPRLVPAGSSSPAPISAVS